MRIPPLRIKIMLESNPLKSMMLVRITSDGLPIWVSRVPQPCALQAQGLYHIILCYSILYYIIVYYSILQYMIL